MDVSLLPALFSGFFSFVAIKTIKPVAIRTGLVDLPDHRKHHQGAIPLIGGIAIYLAVLATAVLFFGNMGHLPYWLVASGLIVLLGVLDDYKDLKVRPRLISQVMIAGIMVFGAGDYLESLGNLLGFGEALLPNWLAWALTIVAVIGAINAFNMVDGIDGLAGSLSLTTFLALALLFAVAGEKEVALLCAIVVAAIIPYLLFNLSLLGSFGRKIFMGDAGSMFIGLSVVWLLVIGTQGSDSAFKPVTALWLITIPLMDMAGIMLRRIRKGLSPFKPDRDHLHHIFLRAGFTERHAMLIIWVSSLFLAGCGIALEWLEAPEWFSLTLFLAFFAIYNYSLQHIWKLLTLFHRFSGKRPVHL